MLYDDTNWILIANELSHGNLSLIPPKSRAMLIDDASVFVEKGILRFRILLELIKYLEHEVSHTHTELVYLLPHREQKSHKIHVEERAHGAEEVRRKNTASEEGRHKTNFYRSMGDYLLLKNMNLIQL